MDSKHIDILKQAEKIISNDREKAYGNKLANHTNIARLWSAYLDIGISAKEVAMMMCLLKIARTKLGDYHPDNYVDLVGYGAIAGSIADKTDSQLKFDFKSSDGEIE
jgi:hypothetical protein